MKIPASRVRDVNNIAINSTWPNQRRGYMSGFGESIGLIEKRKRKRLTMAGAITAFG